MSPNIVGALLNSALYLLCVFAAGLATGHPSAWKLALVAMGVTYLSHYAQIWAWLVPATVSVALVAVSIAIGAAAGISLLF